MRYINALKFLKFSESILSSVAESLSALLLSFIIHQNEKIKSVGFAGATLIKQMYPTGIAQNDSEKFLLASINK